MNPLLNQVFQAVVLAALAALTASLQEHFNQQYDQK